MASIFNSSSSHGLILFAYYNNEVTTSCCLAFTSMNVPGIFKTGERAIEHMLLIVNNPK